MARSRARSGLQRVLRRELQGLGIPAEDAHKIGSKIRNQNILAGGVDDGFVLMRGSLSVGNRTWMVESVQQVLVVGELATSLKQPAANSRSRVVGKSDGSLASGVTVDDA